MHRNGDFVLELYFRFVFDWFTRFYAVNIIENIDMQSSSLSESLKSCGLVSQQTAFLDFSTAHALVLSIRAMCDW